MDGDMYRVVESDSSDSEQGRGGRQRHVYLVPRHNFGLKWVCEVPSYWRDEDDFEVEELQGLTVARRASWHPNCKEEREADAAVAAGAEDAFEKIAKALDRKYELQVLVQWRRYYDPVRRWA